MKRRAAYREAGHKQAIKRHRGTELERKSIPKPAANLKWLVLIVLAVAFFFPVLIAIAFVTSEVAWPPGRDIYLAAALAILGVAVGVAGYYFIGRRRRKVIRGAILGADLATVERLLRKQPSLSRTIYEPGHTLLHDVASYARIRGCGFASTAADLLLDAGADIDAVNQRGETALHIVCSDNTSDMDTARFLVSRKADLNILGSEGLSAFHLIVGICSQTRAPDLVEFCIAHGADVNLRTGNQKNRRYAAAASTPLHFAAYKLGMGPKDSEVIRLLLKYGADPKLKDASGTLPCKVS